MPIYALPEVDQSAGTSGARTTITHICVDYATPAAALAASLALGPTVTDLGLMRLSFDRRDVGHRKYEIVWTYGVPQVIASTAPGTEQAEQQPSESQPTDQVGFGFAATTGMSSIKITKSFQTISSTKKIADTRNIPDFKRAVNVNKGRVEGVEVPSPRPEFSFSYKVPAFNLNFAYFKKLCKLCGKTNDAAFKTFATNELVYLGSEISGSASASEASMNMSFKFGFQDSENIDLGDGWPIITKAGWDYLWVLYESAQVGGFMTEVPAFAYVERVIKQGNFRQLGIGI